MMDPAWLALDFAIGSALIGAVVWFVRLEGSAKANGDRLDKLEKAADAHVAQRDAIIRLEEQVKHLTALIERLDDRIALALTPHAPPKPRPRAGA